MKFKKGDKVIIVTALDDCDEELHQIPMKELENKIVECIGEKRVVEIESIEDVIFANKFVYILKGVCGAYCDEELIFAKEMNWKKRIQNEV